ncbi:hypothetical protein NPIL_680391 [Nephila pilipes]|uniref:Uncharacterized protein n=1 Tax=Nephila pilipes TaxID=299642 RepID=A0A8X6NMS1_NEPPI|nr:hypothetical protein NPIL_680391 [Nephila pilipes]
MYIHFSSQHCSSDFFGSIVLDDIPQPFSFTARLGVPIILWMCQDSLSDAMGWTSNASETTFHHPQDNSTDVFKLAHVFAEQSLRNLLHLLPLIS